MDMLQSFVVGFFFIGLLILNIGGIVHDSTRRQ